jgi:hypothetical protein
MQRVLTLTLLLLVVLTGSVAAGIALAEDGAFDPSVALDSSAPAGLLPPIAIEGRKGWACVAERSATAKNLRDAALPIAR